MNVLFNGTFILLYVLVGTSKSLVTECFHLMENLFKLDTRLIATVLSKGLFIVKMQLIKIHPSDPTRQSEWSGLGAVMVIHFPCCLVAVADERSQTRGFMEPN